MYSFLPPPFFLQKNNGIFHLEERLANGITAGSAGMGVDMAVKAIRARVKALLGSHAHDTGITVGCYHQKRNERKVGKKRQVQQTRQGRAAKTVVGLTEVTIVFLPGAAWATPKTKTTARAKMEATRVESMMLDWLREGFCGDVMKLSGCKKD